MQDTNSIFEQINDDNCNLNEIRISILDLISNKLINLKSTLDTWELLFFSDAISDIAVNINHNKQPTKSWLKASLHNIEKALTPAEQRDERINLNDKTHTHESLLNRIETLRLSLIR